MLTNTLESQMQLNIVTDLYLVSGEGILLVARKENQYAFPQLHSLNCFNFSICDAPPPPPIVCQQPTYPIFPPHLPGGVCTQQMSYELIQVDRVQ